MIRLAFVVHFNRTWIGGINVILNLINLILKLKQFKKKIKIVLFTNSKKKISKFKLSKNVEIIENSEIFERNIILKIIDKLLIILIGKTFFLERLLVKYRINYISHSNIVTGNKSKTKSIIWLPDFQYIYFPSYFSLKYKILRKINIFIFKDHAFKILLSSQSAKNDLKKICKIKNNNLIVSKFKFYVPTLNKLKNKNYLKRKYNIKNKFFYMPNQYWLHKNHLTVINALNHLKKNGNNKISIVSSGDSKDYRHPDNFKNLISLVKKYKIEKNYIYLGLIPFIDVLSLIYHSQAVINPSFFEGWSSTVEQAKAYNKKVILSDISVHREQRPKYSFFFHPKNYFKLSKILDELNSKKQFNTNNTNLNKNIENYAKKYCEIILNN